MAIIEDLSKSYVLTAGASLLPMPGRVGSGLSAFVFPDLKSGVSFIDDHFLSISLTVEKLGFGEPNLNKMAVRKGRPRNLRPSRIGEWGRSTYVFPVTWRSIILFT